MMLTSYYVSKKILTDNYIEKSVQITKQEAENAIATLKNIDNMLVAGRCISSTHEAQASLRIMPHCAETGQAAGAAVFIAKEDNVNIRYANTNKIQKILKEECFMLR